MSEPVDIPDVLLHSVDRLDPTLGTSREERIAFLLKRGLLDLPDGAFVPEQMLAANEVEDTYELWDELGEGSIESVSDEEAANILSDMVDAEPAVEKSPIEKGLSWLYGNGEGTVDSISTDVMDGVTCTIISNQDDPEEDRPLISFRTDEEPFIEQDVMKLLKRVRPALDEHDARIVDKAGGEEHKHVILTLNRLPSPDTSIPTGWSP